MQLVLDYNFTNYRYISKISYLFIIKLVDAAILYVKVISHICVQFHSYILFFSFVLVLYTESPVSISKNDTDIVVTEYGVAPLKGKIIKEHI